MDQLKQYLAVALKYHFWILCGLITLIFLGTWYMASSTLEQEYTTRKSEIDSNLSKAKVVLGTTPHPNQISNDAMDQRVNELTENVQQVWQRQYQQQQDILKWPSELPPQFINAVDDLQPIEAKLPAPPLPASQEIPVNLREIYRDYIMTEIPKLADIIGASWTVDMEKAGSMASGPYGGAYGGDYGSGMDSYYDPAAAESGYGAAGYGASGYGSGMPGMPGTPGATANTTPIVVDWKQSSQQQIAQSFYWSQPPGTLDVLYRQEDLWVLRALMHIIAKTNEGADYQYQAAVKSIEYITIAQQANSRAGQVSQPQATQAAGMGGGYGYGYGEGDYSGDDLESFQGTSDPTMVMPGAGSGSMPSDPTMGSYGTGAPMAVRDPAHLRYVDNEYQPLPADRLRQALAPDNRLPADAFLVVAKRMPVRMRLTVDQRKLPRLLAECGNSDLPLEVRQVRVNTPSGEAASGEYGGGMMGGMMGGMGGGYEMEMGGGEYPGGGSGQMMDDYGSGYGSGMDGSGMGGYGVGGAAQASGPSPYDIKVELYGIIYIYNPPNTDQLAVAEVDAETAAEIEAAEAAEADATPVAPQPPMAPQPGQLQPGQPQPGQPQPGQVQPGQPQPSQPQPGQLQPGQPQPGQLQPGQPQPGQLQPSQPQPGQLQPGQPQPGQLQPGQPQPGQPQPGQPQPGQPQPGQPQPGQLQPGQPQPGQPQPGQPQPGQPQPAGAPG